ncbi:putative reverse transcriptase domain-containing protein [Tanacetum coccineum]|uniref:Reverse transcriptase domain-containing protein n=1 Tax=Tanacetum coccineum TaxID=301880 RepID=A0ABQ4ZH59_9ASTR
MDAPPSPNHMLDFPADDPSSSDESDVESEEDPQEEPHEENVNDEKPELIFLYEVKGSPYPPPLASLKIKLVVDIVGFRALRAAQETACVENIRLRRELEEAQISNTLMSMGRDGAEKEIFRLGAWLYGYHEEAVVARVVGVRPSEAIDVLAVYGESQPPITMPPTKLKRRTVERMVQKQYAEEEKVKFVACTFEGRALTWWNRNVHTLGLANANQIPLTNVETMMTTEYCLATEIQKMEQELWTMNVKGDDIEEHYNRFHELALMCPNLVTPEKKKIERYIRGLPEKVKANAKATRIGESNNRKWEDHQRENSNNRNNNTYHRQRNMRQEAAKAYVAAPAAGKVYLGNLPLCNRCKLHHHDQCSVKCKKCKRIGHQTKDCLSKTSVADTPPTADANV